MTGYLERALLLISLQSPSTIKSSYHSQLSRSKSSMTRKLDPRPEVAEKRSGRCLTTNDRCAIDQFFQEPSPQELAVSSEMTEAEQRIAKIMADLEQKTSEQLESWSLSLDSTLGSTKAFEIEVNEPIEQVPSQASLHAGDMVSSPVSFSHDVTVPNMVSVSTASAARKANKPLEQESIPSTNTFAFSDKPSFQSFLRKVGKTPPPGTVIRDFAYPCSSTSQNQSSDSHV